MRLYTFTNMYLSDIQKGIQSAHLVHEIMNEAHDNCMTIASDSDLTTQEIHFDKKALMVKEWAEEHKTMIVCNGGNSANLNAIGELFSNTQNPYPFAWFNEDEESLNGAITCVGIVLPEELYDCVRRADVEEECGYVYETDTHVYRQGQYMFDLLDMVKRARLA